MITDIEIDDKDELVYDLSSIGLKGELVVSPENTIYIMTEDDYFSIDNIEEIGNEIVIKNDENSLRMDKEKFSLIEEILKNTN
jgi:hypothetical protein